MAHCYAFSRPCSCFQLPSIAPTGGLTDCDQGICILQSFLEASPEQITEVVQTNLLGTLLCTRAAMQALSAQARGGHIFNMDGAGANNLPSPMYTAYGATKAGMSFAALTYLFSAS